jgi:hypothetical protein
LIVGTQVDLRNDESVRDKLAKQKMQPVTKDMGERMAKELGAVRYVECSALTQFKLKDVFDEVCHAWKLSPPFREFRVEQFLFWAFNETRLTYNLGNRCSVGTTAKGRKEKT